MTKKENRLELADRCLRRSLDEHLGPAKVKDILVTAIAYRNLEHRENPEKYEGNDPTPRIFIKISGGRVQGTVSDVPMDVEVLDYDIDGVEDDELYEVPEKDGEIDDCIVYSEQPLVDAAYCDAIDTALTDDEEGSVADRGRVGEAEQDAGEVVRDLGDDL